MSAARRDEKTGQRRNEGADELGDWLSATPLTAAASRPLAAPTVRRGGGGRRVGRKRVPSLRLASGEARRRDEPRHAHAAPSVLPNSSACRLYAYVSRPISTLYIFCERYCGVALRCVVSAGGVEGDAVKKMEDRFGGRRAITGPSTRVPTKKSPPPPANGDYFL